MGIQFMTYLLKIKENAIKLRTRGLSLNEIVDRLKISKGTASVWLANIELSSKATKRLEKRQIIGQYKTLLIKKRKRKELFKRLETEAVGKLKEVCFCGVIYQLLAAILFWCEGSKGNLTKVGFTNSDPVMARLFLKCLRKGFKIKEEKFRIVVHLHSYHDEETQIKFWSRVTNIPVNQFSKSFQKKNSGKRVRNNYQGCISIRYYDAMVAKQLWGYCRGLQLFLGV